MGRRWYSFKIKEETLICTMLKTLIAENADNMEALEKSRSTMKKIERRPN